MAANHSIKCSVASCKHHDKGADYCTLTDIAVGQDCSCAKDCCETECLSFEYM